MKVLVTGASGFAARHVIAELSQGNFELFTTAPEDASFNQGPVEIHAEVCNLTDLDATKSMVRKINPDAVIHLAAMSHVGRAWVDRAQLVNININGTSNLCQALSDLDKKITFLYVSSGQVYARDEDNVASFDEHTLPNPQTPFAASKLAAEYVVRCFESETFRSYAVRAFNVIGPGQSPTYVCGAFAQRIKNTSPGGHIKVGNLDTHRDFCDVRDVARALRLILEKQPEERLFVLGSGRKTPVKHILEKLIEISRKEVSAECDRALFRPADPESVVANPSLAKDILGWEPEITLDQSLTEIYQSITDI